MNIALRWVEEIGGESLLVGDDGEILGSVTYVNFSHLYAARVGRTQRVYIDRESAKRAVELWLRDGAPDAPRAGGEP